MKIKSLINEIEFSIYQAMVRISHAESITVQDVGEMLRAMPGVLTVTQVSHNNSQNKAIMKVKLLTTKPPTEAFGKFKANSLKRIPEVKRVEVAEKTIEKKK